MSFSWEVEDIKDKKMNSESDYLMELIKDINEKHTEVINGNKSNDIEFFYRGHGKQEYMLQPSLYRQIK